MLDALTRTVAALHAMGKALVLVAPPPSADFNVARCAARRLEGKLLPDRPCGCEFSVAEYRSARFANLAFLALVERRHIVPVYRFDDALCRDGMCSIYLDGVLLYRDGGHLSVPSSTLLGRKLDLAPQLSAMAR